MEDRDGPPKLDYQSSQKTAPRITEPPTEHPKVFDRTTVLLLVATVAAFCLAAYVLDS